MYSLYGTYVFNNNLELGDKFTMIFLINSSLSVICPVYIAKYTKEKMNGGFIKNETAF
jgi:hypothetical protein